MKDNNTIDLDQPGGFEQLVPLPEKQLVLGIRGGIFPALGPGGYSLSQFFEAIKAMAGWATAPEWEKPVMLAAAIAFKRKEVRAQKKLES